MKGLIREMAHTLGETIRHFRRTRELTQKQLADWIGCTREHISRIERGVSMPTVPVLMAISDALGVRSSTLMDGLLPDEPPAAVDQPSDDLPPLII